MNTSEFSNFRGDSLRWGTLSYKTGAEQKFPTRASKGLLPNQNFSSQRCQQWRDMCEYTEEGLESTVWNKTHITGKLIYCYTCTVNMLEGSGSQHCFKMYR